MFVTIDICETWQAFSLNRYSVYIFHKDSFGVVSQLEYWCLGFITLSLLVSLLDLVHAHIRRSTRCPIEFSKLTLLVLIVGSKY